MLLRLLPPLVFFDFFVFFFGFLCFFFAFPTIRRPVLRSTVFFLFFFLVPTNEWTERAANDELHWTNQTTTNFTLRNAHGRWFIHRFTRDSATKTKTKQSIWHRCLSLWVQKTRLEFFFFCCCWNKYSFRFFRTKAEPSNQRWFFSFSLFFLLLTKKKRVASKKKTKKTKKMAAPLFRGSQKTSMAISLGHLSPFCSAFFVFFGRLVLWDACNSGLLCFFFFCRGKNKRGGGGSRQSQTSSAVSLLLLLLLPTAYDRVFFIFLNQVVQWLCGKKKRRGRPRNIGNLGGKKNYRGDL